MPISICRAIPAGNDDHCESPAAIFHVNTNRDTMKKLHTIRVLLVDDHFVVRVGLGSLINSQPDMRVVAEAATGAEGVAFYEQHRPNVVLMDLRLPDMSGVQCTEAICKKWPEACVVVLTTFGGDENIYRAMQAGAKSFLLKDVSREEFLQTLRSAQTGGCHMDPAVAVRLCQRRHAEPLSARELEVLRLVAAGRSNKEIADRLAITESTVKNHMTNILMKLRVPDRAGSGGGGDAGWDASTGVTDRCLLQTRKYGESELVWAIGRNSYEAAGTSAYVRSVRLRPKMRAMNQLKPVEDSWVYRLVGFSDSLPILQSKTYEKQITASSNGR